MRTRQHGCPILLYCPHPGELCRGPLPCAGEKEGRRKGLSDCCQHRGALWPGALSQAVYLAVEEPQRRLLAQHLLYLFCHST